MSQDIEKKKRKKKKKIIRICFVIIMIILFLLLIFASYKIINWYVDNVEIEEQTNVIHEQTVIKEKEDTEKTEKVNPPEDKFDPYWDYIKIPLINVEFNKLINTNPDTVGWITVNNTDINYPVVQASNNSFYLNHAFDKTWNDAGWIFMDYRNNSNTFDKNTIIYGHSRYDGSMFCSLRRILRQSWFNNKSNHIIKFSTPNENTLWQVFSVYKIPAESYYLKTTFENDDSYREWLDEMVKRSAFNFKTSINTDDKVMTLSSCYNTEGIRMVLHAKLIKKEAR